MTDVVYADANTIVIYQRAQLDDITTNREFTLWFNAEPIPIRLGWNTVGLLVECPHCHDGHVWGGDEPIQCAECRGYPPILGIGAVCVRHVQPVSFDVAHRETGDGNA